ncbi:hypothetical protein Q8W71_15370 [Methylobacterium sp. NEAU 140]|uniref:hypothetical protein n=1 Tax=Methylobacterium sp. NEAU 140 TaxID=3064945 RepID=UPI002732F95F|nr:hypothetical protein [Methylobacterium sp. NEAU 140]MDP4024010.1 hypothetical protein [Methylobacterium sp. NEAU 140]
MSNVIRPTFGRRPEPAAPAPEAETVQLLRVYGTAAGHGVALIRHEAGPEGPALRIVVGPDGSDTVEAVAVLPDTPEGEADAERTALAILRALAVVEGAEEEPDPA